MGSAGEIRLFAGTLAPAGWAICDGRTLPVSDNFRLFNALDDTYGGDGVETFGLPKLVDGALPIHRNAEHRAGHSGTAALNLARRAPITAIISLEDYRRNDPFLGEIRTFGFGFVPRGWAPCHGAELPVFQHRDLHELIGNTYGGDPGKGTFKLPDLRANVVSGAPAATSIGYLVLNFCICLEGMVPT